MQKIKIISPKDFSEMTDGNKIDFLEASKLRNTKRLYNRDFCINLAEKISQCGGTDVQVFATQKTIYLIPYSNDKERFYMVIGTHKRAFPKVHTMYYSNETNQYEHLSHFMVQQLFSTYISLFDKLEETRIELGLYRSSIGWLDKLKGLIGW